MRNKKIAGAGVAVAASAALLLAASPAFADEESFVDSAYAFSAAGLLDIDPLPAGVESTDGEPISKEVIGLGERTSDAEADGIFVGVLNASAAAGKSEASVARVELLSILRADLIRTFCEGADPDRSGFEIINGTLLGEELPETMVPGQEYDLSPLATIVFNDQTRNADGSLTVTGFELKLLPGANDGRDERLSAADQAALPDLGDLLGVDLPAGAIDTEQDLIDALGVDLDEALQTITVGVATCTELGDDDGDGNNDEDDGDKGDDGSDAGNGSDKGDGSD
ncbi:MAG: hypothetical protein L0I24_25185, partial [Pseudonocardia sp.]|nr:hypothetical protein [Pseudonocardia sp.]